MPRAPGALGEDGPPRAPPPIELGGGGGGVMFPYPYGLDGLEGGGQEYP